MRAKVNLSNNRVEFNSLIDGEFFVYNNILYFKIPKISGTDINAVNIHNGNLAHFDTNIVENVSCVIDVKYCGSEES